MNETPVKHEWSRDQLIEFYRGSVRRFGGHTGFVYVYVAGQCSCSLRANIPHGAGWFCKCGRYNVLPYLDHQTCFVRPDIGPPKHIIWEATTFVVNEKPAKG